MLRELGDMLCVCKHIEKYFPYDDSLKKEYANSVLNFSPQLLQDGIKAIIHLTRNGVDSAGNYNYIVQFDTDISAKDLYKKITSTKAGNDDEKI